MKPFVFIRSFRLFPLLCAAVILLSVVGVVSVCNHLNATAAVKSGETLKGKIIVVDAGHGGGDPGAVGVTGTAEKEINLILSKSLNSLLTKKGAVVVMTRKDDSVYGDTKKEDLDHRVEIIKKAKAELFIGIQCNAVPNSELHGAQTFYYPDSANGEILANAIQQRLIKTLENTDRDALTLTSAYIMRALEIPAVIIEVGFLSNPEEEELLKDEVYREKVVAAIYGGILDYYKKENAAASWFRDLTEYLQR